MRPRRTIAATALACFLAACGVEIEIEDEPAELIDAGSEPRETLRYSRQVGKARYAMTVSRRTIDDLSQARTTRATIDAETVDVAADGDAAVRIVLRDFSSDSGSEALRALRISVEGRVDAFGRADEMAIDVRPKLKGSAGRTLADLARSQETALRSLVMIFPRRPVGVGARWRVQQTAHLAGLVQTLEAETTLVSRDRDLVVMKSTFSARASEGKLQVPGRDEVPVASVEMTGEGTASVRLDELLGEMDKSFRTSIVFEDEVTGETTTGEEQKTMTVRRVR